MRAARYLGISVFEMLKRPVIWRTRALMAEGAEQWLENEREKKRAPRGGLF